MYTPLDLARISEVAATNHFGEHFEEGLRENLSKASPSASARGKASAPGIGLGMHPVRFLQVLRSRLRGDDANG